MQPIIIGLIFNQRQEILIAKRPSHKHLGGLWEFPGGKIEANEDHFQALQRELKEELNIDVINAQYFTEYDYQYHDISLKFHVWHVTQFTGEACGNEEQEIKWVKQQQLSEYQFPPSNNVILEELIPVK